MQKRILFPLVFKIPITGMFSTARVTVEALLETVGEFSGLFGFLNKTISFNSSDKSYKDKTCKNFMGIKGFTCR